MNAESFIGLIGIDSVAFESGHLFKPLMIGHEPDSSPILHPLHSRCPRCGPEGGAQRAQYPLIKEYTLNHNVKAPII